MHLFWKLFLFCACFTIVCAAKRKCSKDGVPTKELLAKYEERLKECRALEKCPSAKEVAASEALMKSTPGLQACNNCITAECMNPCQKGCLKKLRASSCSCPRQSVRAIRKCRICLGGLEDPTAEE
ncbi:uncharacterized protein LOC120329858 [Styela clava]|uniref:uncharacterized protein LOC120329858 n=1 Tax=Styela clava TaxID=7725 RepID=UPI00193AD73A|nr:uncharacterized protein LOC120329858 [Styela clava]